MADVAKVLKEEIQRLARKEAKAAVAQLRKDNAVLKRTIAEHKRRLAKLERENKDLLREANKRGKAMAQATQVADTEVEKARITAKMIRGLRAKLKLSQPEFAKLVDVNPQTVYQWEHKSGRLAFRGGAKARIVEVRKITASEARALLEAAE